MYLGVVFVMSILLSATRVPKNTRSSSPHGLGLLSSSPQLSSARLGIGEDYGRTLGGGGVRERGWEVGSRVASWRDS